MMAVHGMTGTDRLTVSTTPVSLPLTVPGTSTPAMKAVGCDLIVEDNPILYTTGEGIDPATDGVELPVGAVKSLHSYGELKRFRAVRSGGADAAISFEMGTDVRI